VNSIELTTINSTKEAVMQPNALKQRASFRKFVSSRSARATS
jgi:hypothetical protein